MVKRWKLWRCKGRKGLETVVETKLKRGWESFEIETAEEKVELEIDTNEEVVIKENEDELIVEDEENVEFRRDLNVEVVFEAEVKGG